MGIQVAIIGLDAATFDVMLPLVEEGKLPNLARLMERGTWGPLRSTYPPISAPAWVSCLTGKAPGKHGLFDFRHYDPRNYSSRGKLVNSSDFSGSTIFDIISEKGMKVGAFRVPLTYPAWPVNGFMVSGQPTPDRRKAYTFPEHLSAEIGDLHQEGKLKDFQYFENDLYREHIQKDLACHFDAALNLLTNYGADLDLFMMVVNALDAAQHRFWKYHDPQYAFSDPASIAQYGEVVRDCYRQADEGVGRILEKLPADALVLVMSDHGGRLRPHRTVDFNHWLSSMGLLNLQVPAHAQTWWGRMRNRVMRTSPTGPPGEIDWSCTKAYRFPMYPPVDGIEINKVNRQPNGCVRDEYDQVRDAILSEVVKMRDPLTGDPIVLKAWRREEVFSGKYLERIPDIVLLLDDRYEGGSNPGGSLVTLKTEGDYDVWNGYHSMDGILIASGPIIRPGRKLGKAEIMDIAPTALYAMNQPIHEDMDGKVLLDIFSESHASQHPVQTVPARDPETSEQKYVLSREEESDMKKKLKILGYME